MILIDWKVGKAALKLTHNYSDQICYYPETSCLAVVNHLRDVRQSVFLDLTEQEVVPSIERLIHSGYFKPSGKYAKGYFFSITPLLLHRWAFLLDGFKRKFWAGFGCGVITGVVANYLYDTLREHMPVLIQRILTLL